MANLKPEFGYVVGVAVASTLLHNVYMSIRVGQARKKYEIRYPDLYATKDNCPNEETRRLFNCVQRGHQNSLESLPSFLSLLTMSGLQFPVTASALGAAYLVGRVGYFEGYRTGNPDKRMGPWTILQMGGLLGLLGTGIKVAVDLLGKQ